MTIRIALTFTFAAILVLSGCPGGNPGKGNTGTGQIVDGGELRLPVELDVPQQGITSRELSVPQLRALGRATGKGTDTSGFTTSDNGATWVAALDKPLAQRAVEHWESILRKEDSPLRAQLRDLVAGADNFALGKSESISGARIKDGNFEVALTRPFQEFPAWLSQPALEVMGPSVMFTAGTVAADTASGYKGFIHATPGASDGEENKAHLSEITFVFEPDRHRQFELYKEGKLDTCNVAPDDMAEVLADPELKNQLQTYDTAATLVGFIDLHATPWGDAPFKDKTPLRQAVNWAVYRNELAENSGDMFEPWPHFLPQALKRYIDPAALASPLYKVEPEIDKAKEGEALAGHDQASLLPTNMLLSYVEEPFFDQLSEGIHQNLDEISIRMRPYPCKTEKDALQLVKIGSMDIWLQWVYPAYQSPDALFYPTLHSSLAGVGGNYGRCEVKEIDDLIEAAQAEQDESARTKLYQQLENEVEKRALFLMIGSGKANILVNPKLAGLELTPYDFDASLPAQDFSKLGFTE